jgi:biotin carboxyl carrier protein
MIKLKADINGKQHDINLERGDKAVTADIDGRVYEVGVGNPEKGDYLIRHGNQVFACRIEASGKQGSTLAVSVRGSDYEIQIIDPKRSRGVQTGGGHDHGSAHIIASMPGKVVRLLVEVGAQVEAGAGIVVVEAMKMQNEMKAPKAGVVISLNATPGATVNAGDVLAEIE